MNILDYIKDRRAIIIINIFLFILVSIILFVARVNNWFIVLIFLTWILPLFINIFLEYFKQNSFYKNMISVLENLDKKYLLPEVIEEPEFLEGKIVYDVLKETNKNMNENVKYYKEKQAEYREYIETWVHEIKTPIASTKLILENSESEIAEKISYEIKKVEGFIEQVLYYSKSDDVSRDYIIKEFNLSEAVKIAIRNNSRDFINKKIILDLKEIDIMIFSDIKWISFIINQIIGNSIKYSQKGRGKITIYTKSNKNSNSLIIEDNGVGINQRDIDKVFEKGFTGENGRIYGKSTGIGLYLCSSLCKKLGLGIKLESKENVGTKVEIIFPLGKFTLFQ
ncbi:sensor histidine kinase [Clostridium sp. DSM 100503]|uniref:sensor histidine kinase n=1 Tax=Clostridium sp. DSM 100503 TaxID=2963282 RepID=UPI00214A3AC3|nr:sensor histidine kinase [Clostridium sp. DSM 100503]MCR1952597.1 sensor histidine kinase [Clostridium sp. DSM 100503]